MTDRLLHQLSAEEVYAVQARLDVSEEIARKLESELSADELARAERFCFDEDRSRYVAARGMLRQVLGAVTGFRPADFRFTYSEFGKPFLAHPVSSRSLQFNVSHTGNRAIYALVLNSRIGVDIERIRCDISHDEVAKHFFAPSEAEEYFALCSDERSTAFFRCWTRKEAFVKARGEGLSLPFNSFEVSVDPSEEAQLRSTMPDPTEAQRWSMFDIPAGEHYAAALVVEATNIRVNCLDFNV